jgi:hypothetical protein
MGVRVRRPVTDNSFHELSGPIKNSEITTRHFEHYVARQITRIGSGLFFYDP